jgi:hypothetical protein
VYEHQKTVDGLTLTLKTRPFSSPVDWGYAGGEIACGNVTDCSPYLADFSAPLIAAQVDLLRAEDRSGSGDDLEPALFYLEAYSEAGGTGALLTELEADGTGGPATLALTAPAGSLIRSLVFGSTARCVGDCRFGDRENLGVADDLIVTPVPEPSEALLFATSLIGLGLMLASRRAAVALGSLSEHPSSGSPPVAQLPTQDAS